MQKSFLLSCIALLMCASCSGFIYEGSKQQKEDDLNAPRLALEKRWRDKTAQAFETLASTLPPDKALVVGRLTLANGDRDLTQEVDFLFNYNHSFFAFNTADEIGVMNKDGYFCVLLSAGRNTFGGFMFNRYRKWLLSQDSEPSFEAEGNGRITYIGDININFGRDRDAPNDRRIRIQIAVSDGVEAASQFFGRQLRVERSFTSSLIKGGDTFTAEETIREAKEKK